MYFKIIVAFGNLRCWTVQKGWSERQTWLNRDISNLKKIYCSYSQNPDCACLDTSSTSKSCLDTSWTSKSCLWLSKKFFHTLCSIIFDRLTVRIVWKNGQKITQKMKAKIYFAVQSSIFNNFLVWSVMKRSFVLARWMMALYATTQ